MDSSVTFKGERGSEILIRKRAENEFVSVEVTEGGDESSLIRLTHGQAQALHRWLGCLIEQGRLP